jgi:hypothetical protein
MSETINYKGYDIDIKHDESGESPRTTCDNGGRMICFHGRYNLGDEKHEFSSPQELQDYVDSDKVLAKLDLFLYDHSGITMSTGAFSCRFDSGQVGVIYIDQEGCDKMGYTEEWAKGDWNEGGTFESALLQILESEVKEYDKFISEGVFYYTIDEVEDSCGGFLGYDHKESGLMEYAENAIDCHIQGKLDARLAKLKKYIQDKVPVIYRQLPAF